MLDVSRHFYTIGEVKELLDVMALYKMNKFHWHLTDDQGWRIEIKKYPLLTEKEHGANSILMIANAYVSQRLITTRIWQFLKTRYAS